MDLQYGSEYEEYRRELQEFLASWPPTDGGKELPPEEQERRFRQQAIERRPDVLLALLLAADGDAGNLAGCGEHARHRLMMLWANGSDRGRTSASGNASRGDVEAPIARSRRFVRGN